MTSSLEQLIANLEAFKAVAKDRYFDERTVERCITIVRQHFTDTQAQEEE